MLYYHKCDDCLTPFASVEAKVDECDCGGNVSFMGMVHGEKYEHTENRPVCDGRCTQAHGPICDCECRGANHGTGRVIATVVREGKVVVSDPNADIHDEMVRGYKFRELRDKAEEIFSKLFAGVPAFEYNYRVARHDLNKAIGLRVYERRQKAILEFIFKHLQNNPDVLK
jgi:hypothetical protein